MVEFIKRANKGGRVHARQQKFRTKNIDEIMTIYGVESLDDLSKVKLSPEDALKVIELVGEDYQIPFDATSLYASAMALKHATFLDPIRSRPLHPCEGDEGFEEWI
jgi:hypothetical protein